MRKAAAKREICVIPHPAAVILRRYAAAGLGHPGQLATNALKKLVTVIIIGQVQNVRALPAAFRLITARRFNITVRRAPPPSSIKQMRRCASLKCFALTKAAGVTALLTGIAVKRYSFSADDAAALTEDESISVIKTLLII